MSTLRYRELIALLRHPLVPLDADVEVAFASGAPPLLLGMVGDLLNKAFEFSEERLDAWLVDAGVHYEPSIKVGCVWYRLRMSDPLP